MKKIQFNNGDEPITFHVLSQKIWWIHPHFVCQLPSFPVRYIGEGNGLSFLENSQVQRICLYFSVVCHKVWMIGTCSRGSVTIMITLIDHCSWEERSYMDRNFRIKFFSGGFKIWLLVNTWFRGEVKNNSLISLVSQWNLQSCRENT